MSNIFLSICIVIGFITLNWGFAPVIGHPELNHETLKWCLMVFFSGAGLCYLFKERIWKNSASIKVSFNGSSESRMKTGTYTLGPLMVTASVVVLALFPAFRIVSVSDDVRYLADIVVVHGTPLIFIFTIVMQTCFYWEDKSANKA